MSLIKVGDNYVEHVAGDIITVGENDEIPIGIAMHDAISGGMVMLRCGSMCFSEEPKKEIATGLKAVTYTIPGTNVEVNKIVMD